MHIKYHRSGNVWNEETYLNEVWNLLEALSAPTMALGVKIHFRIFISIDLNQILHTYIFDQEKYTV